MKLMETNTVKSPLAVMLEIEAQRKALIGERYERKQTLAESVKVLGWPKPQIGTIEIEGVRKDVPLHRSAKAGLESYALVVMEAPKTFNYKDQSENIISVPAGTRKYVLVEV
jgi:hypothetical protein